MMFLRLLRKCQQPVFRTKIARPSQPMTVWRGRYLQPGHTATLPNLALCRQWLLLLFQLVASCIGVRTSVLARWAVFWW